MWLWPASRGHRHSRPHRQFGDVLVGSPDATQSVRHGPGGFSNDASVSGIGLRLTKVKVGDTGHRQPGQAGHSDASALSDRDWCAERTGQLQ